MLRFKSGAELVVWCRTMLNGVPETPLFPLFVYSHNYENKGVIFTNSLIINDDDIAKDGMMSIEFLNPLVYLY